MDTNSLQSDAPTEAKGQGLPTLHGSEILAMAINALRKWDAACKAADACNSNAESDNYDEDEWERLSDEHEAALSAAESAKDEVLAMIDSQNVNMEAPNA